MKKKKFIIGIAILLAVGGIAFYKIRSNSKSSVSYQTAQVTKGTLTVSVNGTGNIAVEKRSNVNPGISGEVYDLSVKVGDQVKKDQTLFKISNDQLDIQVDKGYVTYLQSKQSLENAKAQLQEAHNTRDALDTKTGGATDGEKSAADQKITASELSIQAAEVNVDSSYADYQNQKETAAKRTVKAPMDGTITTLNINNGDQLSSSGTSNSSTSSGSSGTSSSSSSGTSSSSSSGSSSSAPIVIDDLSSLKASISINEVDASKVKNDQKVSMTFDAIDGLTLTGKVERISTVGTNSSGVVRRSC